jgi:hypothetical protein
MNECRQPLAASIRMEMETHAVRSEELQRSQPEHWGLQSGQYTLPNTVARKDGTLNTQNPWFPASEPTCRFDSDAQDTAA